MNRSKGFSLIEVLVTLLLTTLGILGMVALQSRSIQYTADAAQRNAAAELSAQLVNIMRSNPAEIFQETPPAFPAYSGIKNLTITAGIKNLLNTDPPFSVTYDTNTGAGSSWEPRVADPRGRAYTLRVEYRMF